MRGPAIIGAGARLIDAYVGPYTAIGEDCLIQNAEVEHSILLAGSSVRGPRRAHGVLAAGPQRRVRRDDRQPRAYRFMVGDNSEIGILYARRSSPARRACSGSDVLRRGRARRQRRHRRCSAPSSTSPTRDACAAAIAAAAPGRGRSTAPPGPTSTAPRSDEPARAAVNGDAPGNVAHAARAAGARVRARLDRLRLRRRRRRGPTSSPTRAGADRRLRPHQARRRASVAGRRPLTPSRAPRGCSAPAARTSSTRCCALGADARRGRRVVDDQIGCPTWTGHLAPRAARARRATRDAASSTSPAPATARGTTSRSRSSAQAGVDVPRAPRRPPSIRRPAPRPAWSACSAPSATDAAAAADWHGGPRRATCRARGRRA